MLRELIYRDRVYIMGKPAEIKRRLAEHALKYSTVRELLDDLHPSGRQ